mmetsp:Transcript_13299/g.24780  ORF Transcript_13299/g.24780 Transcript_13299/m.24780 type:complete len:270 (+) Transcript_13299:1178-1987(+)
MGQVVPQATALLVLCHFNALVNHLIWIKYWSLNVCVITSLPCLTQNSLFHDNICSKGSGCCIVTTIFPMMVTACGFIYHGPLHSNCPRCGTGCLLCSISSKTTISTCLIEVLAFHWESNVKADHPSRGRKRHHPGKLLIRARCCHNLRAGSLRLQKNPVHNSVRCKVFVSWSRCSHGLWAHFLGRPRGPTDNIILCEGFIIARSWWHGGHLLNEPINTENHEGCLLRIFQRFLRVSQACKLHRHAKLMVQSSICVHPLLLCVSREGVSS